jgi:nitrite reductase/ring-hydroxylating ferredoxin subunit
MPKYVVATVDEIPPGGRKVVDVAGRSIGVFNVSGEYLALRNRCPHQGGPLCEGRVSGFVVSETPGEYRYSRPGEILRCPWHGWEFDMRTGQSWFDPKGVRVRAYEVAVAPGSALPPDAHPIDKPQEAANPADMRADEDDMGGLEKGPYVAETYEVTVEKQYVLVNVPG